MAYIKFLTIMVLLTIAGCYTYQEYATTTVRGTVELATTAEAQAGTNGSTVITPETLTDFYDNRIVEVSQNSSTGSGAYAASTIYSGSAASTLFNGYMQIDATGCSVSGGPHVITLRESGSTNVEQLSVSNGNLDRVSISVGPTDDVRISAGSCGVGTVQFRVRGTQIND